MLDIKEYLKQTNTVLVTQDAFDELVKRASAQPDKDALDDAYAHGYTAAESEFRKRMAQPEIIRCKDCRWWDKYNEMLGYCMAAKHGHLSEHWEISIRRTYKADFYCADAERRTDDLG